LKGFDLYGNLTPKQQEALEILKTDKTRVMFYGGARSGKTFLFLAVIVLRALKYPGSRHLIARLRFAHAKTAIWLDTMPTIIKLMGLDKIAKWNQTDHYIDINGSEIWIDGLDDKDRVDKILGREYATIYFNEMSQIPYPTITTVLTRLAQKVKGLKNKAYFDCNPPSKLHWSYKQFIQGNDPETGEPLSNADRYAYLRLNPVDNMENLPDDYIEMLEHLPEDKKRRFLDGEYGDSIGAIFKNWDIIDEIPDEVKRHSRRSPGLDFGFSVDPAALLDIYVNGDDVYINELIYEKELTNQQIARKMKLLEIDKALTQADSAEPKSIHELKMAGIRCVGVQKGADSIRAGIDWLLGKRLHVTKQSVNTIIEFQEYVWSQDKDGNFEPKPIDNYNHAMDALRYGVDPIRRKSSPVISANIKR
jgi:PBSX family phage terminase large subunit